MPLRLNGIGEAETRAAYACFRPIVTAAAQQCPREAKPGPVKQDVDQDELSEE
jgi:hypothetical protein